MKPSQLFLSIEDFSNRFKDTFIYYDGIPKYVANVSMVDPSDRSSYVFYVLDFERGLEPSQTARMISLDDEGVNFRSYNLGYIRVTDSHTVWIARAPFRQWKQGLRHDQCSTTGYTEEPYLLPSSYTYQMLMNSYPTPQEVHRTLRAYPLSDMKVPVHKNFAIWRNGGMKVPAIEYKGKNICTMIQPQVILPNYQYLFDIAEYKRVLDDIMMIQAYD